MGVSIPQPFKTQVSGSMGSIGPVTVGGIPDTYHINVDKLPKIQVGLDPIEVKPLDITTHMDPVTVNMRLERIPDIRAHLPADFSVGLSVLGIPLLCVRLCGEAQMITEPYRPNPCEICGGRHDPDKPHDDVRPVSRAAVKG